jgi:hypothetical protein
MVSFGFYRFYKSVSSDAKSIFSNIFKWVPLLPRQFAVFLPNERSRAAYSATARA